jgi:glycine betaine/proline transport system permease protein
VTAISLPVSRRLDPVLAKRLLAGVLAAAVVLLFILFHGQWTLPHDQDFPLFKSLNGVKQAVDQNRTLLDPIRLAIAALVDGFNGGIAFLGWPGVLAVAGGLGLIFGGLRLAILCALGFAALGVLGLWDASMATLGLMLAAVVISLLIGIPLGIMVGRSDRLSAIVTPILDVMQIMPTFAYLAPMTLLFLIGAPSSTIATLIYAIPPAIRITSLGIRGVEKETVEAATSLGSTRWQVLTKVQLPLARRTIGIGVNQTIMMALSMVVITGLIGAPGLGRNILQALSKVDVGGAFDAGLAIVILAIVLDRLTERAGEWMDPRFRRSDDTDLRRRRILYGAVVAGVVAIVVAGHVLTKPTVFPKAVTVSFRVPVNDIVHWITGTFSGLTLTIKNVFTFAVLNPLETVLTTAPWWLVVAVVVLVAWYVSGRRASITAGICLGIVVLLGLWNHSMQTLASVLVATLITLALGVVVGILSARSDRLRTVLRPFLDAAQTMPAFVYLIPAIALFAPSRFTAIVAAVIYAVPPVIRLVDAGIRSVSKTVLEAATASGSTERQLLWKVQLPLSRRALLVAANQGIVLVLAMVVIGGLVGAGALGYDVVTGFAQGTDFGKGLAAGTAIVLIGIMLDRITQGAGGRRRTQVARAG